MSQEKPIANLSEQLNKSREALNQIKNVSKTLDDTVGNTNAKGVGAVTDTIWRSLLSYFSKIPDLFFGRTSSKKGQKSTNFMDYGLSYLISLMSIIDLCSIIDSISIVTNNLNISRFNPNQNPPPDDYKWKVQKQAYDIQIVIDQFLNVYALTSTPGTAITNAITAMSPGLEKLISKDYLGSDDMRKSFPQSDQMNNFLSDTFSDFTNTGAISNTDKTRIDKFIKKINLIRQTCVLIQGFTTPASLSNYAKSALSPSLIETIDRLGVDNIDQNKLSEIIASLQKKVTTLNKISSFILKYVQYLQLVIRTSLIIVKIFKIIINFLLLLPIPNVVLIAGINIGLSKGERKLDDYVNKIIKLISEINLYVSMIVGFLRPLTFVLDQTILDLELILRKLKSCTRDINVTGNTSNKINSDNTNVADTERIKIIETLTTELKTTNQSFKDFITNYETKKENNKKTYEGYTIEIRIEDVSDQNVLKTILPRRYGIALDSAGIQAVRSDLTFASDDNVIINQVKLLLVSKGLVKPQEEVFTSQQMDILNDAMAALDDNSALGENTTIGNDAISMDDIPTAPSLSEYMDAPDNEDENDGLGLNAFVNKLNGGKRLRKRIKESMAASKEKLNSDIQSVKK